MTPLRLLLPFGSSWLSSHFWLVRNLSEEIITQAPQSSLKTIHKIVAGLFVLGKVSTIGTAGLLFVDQGLFLTSLTITCLLIGTCMLLCIVEITRKHFDVDSKIERLEKELEELRKIKNEG